MRYDIFSEGMDRPTVNHRPLHALMTWIIDTLIQLYVETSGALLDRISSFELFSFRSVSFRET